MNSITITKVVSKNFITDYWAKIQNIIGQNLSAYEKMIQEGIKQIEKEIKEKNIELSWYRYEITQLTNGSIAIMFYGDKI